MACIDCVHVRVLPSGDAQVDAIRRVSTVVVNGECLAGFFLMADSPGRSTRVVHPILRLEVVGADGARQSEHRVFCRYQQRSVPVTFCCTCAHCDAVVDGPRPSVNCTVTLDEAELAPDPHGIRTAVGAMLEGASIAIDPATTVRDALLLLRSDDCRSIAVVDNTHTMVGVVHEAAFVPDSRRGAEMNVPRRPSQEVFHLMSGTIAIHERVPIRKAIELLAAAHLREATVVDDEGVPLGTFRDVAGLRWLAAARSGK